MLARRSEEAAERVARAASTRSAEPRWPASIAVVVAILFSALLPDKLTLGRPTRCPVFEGLLLAVLRSSRPSAGRTSPPGTGRSRSA